MRENTKIEIWKPIEGYEGHYEVSTYGRVRSVDRIIEQQRGTHLYRGCIIKQYPNNKGYMTVRLSMNSTKRTFTVHRLVASAFIDNPNNLPCINHKDETKSNYVWNLEWCTQSYNLSYGTLPNRRRLAYGKRVAMYDLNGEYIKSFLSIHSAHDETGVSRTQIRNCCDRLSHTAGGYLWRYDDNDRQDYVEKPSYKNKKRIVLQYDKGMKLLGQYSSIREAERITGFKHENIGACCRGKMKTSNGYIWKYAE